MQLEYAKDPVWANAEHTAIDLTIKWDGIDEELPFTASQIDPEPHGKAIFEAAAKGDFGKIGDYVPPPEPIPDPKLVGIEIEGVMCSATRDDQNGLAAVLLAFQMQGAQFKPTEFHFANGSKLLLTAKNIQAFAAVWMPFRQSFFQPETV
jgi:hypothetical protein